MQHINIHRIIMKEYLNKRRVKFCQHHLMNKNAKESLLC
jgi:hypothetical protein